MIHVDDIDLIKGIKLDDLSVSDKLDLIIKMGWIVKIKGYSAKTLIIGFGHIVADDVESWCNAGRFYTLEQGLDWILYTLFASEYESAKRHLALHLGDEEIKRFSHPDILPAYSGENKSKD